MSFGYGNYGNYGYGRYVDFSRAEQQKFQNDMANYERVRNQNREEAKNNTIKGGIIIGTIITLAVLAKKGKLGPKAKEFLGKLNPFSKGGKKAAEAGAKVADVATASAAAPVAQEGLFTRVKNGVKNFFSKLNPFKKKAPTNLAGNNSAGKPITDPSRLLEYPTSSTVNREVPRVAQTPDIQTYRKIMGEQAELGQKLTPRVNPKNVVITDPKRLLGYSSPVNTVPPVANTVAPAVRPPQLASIPSAATQIRTNAEINRVIQENGLEKTMKKYLYNASTMEPTARLEYINRHLDKELARKISPKVSSALEKAHFDKLYTDVQQESADAQRALRQRLAIYKAGYQGKIRPLPQIFQEAKARGIKLPPPKDSINMSQYEIVEHYNKVFAEAIAGK